MVVRFNNKTPIDEEMHQMPEKKPTVTVIVTAFRRKEFLSQTLESLEKQTAPRDLYEVLVIKDFEDEAVDRKIAALGWRSILNRNQPLGPFISEAVESSRGEILSFLDDDDLFEPDKIARVVEVFTRHPHVGYYHNALTFIGTGGEEIRPPYAFNFSESKEPSHARILRTEEIPESINRLIYLRHDFNKSSISVRKDILLRYIDLSRKMPSAYDSFIFFCSALSDYSMFVDSMRLTRYRLNKKSVSASSAYGFSGRQIKTFELLLGMAEAAGNREIANLLERQILFFRTIYAIHNPIGNRRDVMIAALTFIRHVNRYSRMGNTFAGVLSATYMVSPRLSKRLYSKLTAPEV